MLRVWVTRDENDNGPLSSALREAGLAPVVEPVLVRRVINDCALVIGQLSADDWLVLTSPFAVNAVAREQSRKPNVAVVAESSRVAAEGHGFRVELVSRDGTGEGLFGELRRSVHSGKVCYPRSSLATPPKPWENVEVISPVLYTTEPREFDRGIVGRVNLVTVVSPSAVEAIGNVDLPYASIGPTTTKALKKLGIKPVIQAAKPEFVSLATAIAEQWKAAASRG
jgi:uroporphyrinogen-III synthase